MQAILHGTVSGSMQDRLHAAAEAAGSVWGAKIMGWYGQQLNDELAVVECVEIGGCCSEHAWHAGTQQKVAKWSDWTHRLTWLTWQYAKWCGRPSVCACVLQINRGCHSTCDEPLRLSVLGTPQVTQYLAV